MEQDIRERLAARAKTVVPGLHYNHYRRELQEQPDPPFFYEAVLPTDAPARALIETVMPAMARFLKSQDIDPERPRGVLVGLFFLDRCYVLQAEQLLSLFCELEGLNAQALHFRVLRWLSA